MKKTIDMKKGLTALGLVLVSSPMFAAATQAEAATTSTLDFILTITAIGQLILLILLGYITGKVAKTKGLWFNKKMMTLLILVGSMLYSAPGFAAETVEVTETASASMMSSSTLLLIVVNLVLFVVLMYLKKLSSQLLELATGIKEKEVTFEGSLTDIVPIEDEADIMTDHEYDGIRELDNNLPPWWIGMFYLTIIFSVIYIPYYHGGGGLLQEEEYLAEIEQGEKDVAAFIAMKGSMVDETNVTASTSASVLKNGKDIFIAKCAACHGQAGEGNVGPNLTDEYWLHGGDIKDVFKSIKYGIPEKGMIAWETQMSPTEISETASYIMSLKGSNPPNPKAAQGELYKAEVTEDKTEEKVEATTEEVEAPEEH